MKTKPVKLVVVGKPYRQWKVGDTFEVPRSKAKTIKLLGRAVDAPAAVVPAKPQAVAQTQPMPSSEPSEDIQPQRRTYKRRELMEAFATEPETEEARPRRQYRRRDLTAEE